MHLLIAILAGVATWSLLEYVIHRWLGHDRRFIRNPFGTEHTAHHSRGNYFAAAWKKAVVAGGALVTLSVVATFVVGPQLGSAYAAGLVGFYLCYEVIHRLEHVRPAATAYGRWARRHHFHHHFHNPSRNFGVTSPIWDVVFATLARPGRIVVPRKLAMTWLIDPATNDVRVQYAAHYALTSK